LPPLQSNNGAQNNYTTHNRQISTPNFLFFGRGWGAGQSPAKPTTTAAAVKPILPYNEAIDSGEQECFFLFSVVGGVMPRQKSSLSMA
jgi:hypothetical protein